jgi:hypothetical protein
MHTGLSQITNIDKVLKRLNMDAAGKRFLPISHGVSLRKTQGPSSSDGWSKMNAILCALAVGSIMYSMICTRLDVSYALSVTNRYQADLNEGQWTMSQISLTTQEGLHICSYFMAVSRTSL